MISLGHRDGLKETGYVYIAEREITTNKIGGRNAYLVEKGGTLMIGYEQLNKRINGMPLSIFKDVRPAEQYNDTHPDRYCQVCHNQDKHPLTHPEYKDLRACRECHKQIYKIFHQLLNETDNAQIATKLI